MRRRSLLAFSFLALVVLIAPGLTAQGNSNKGGGQPLPGTVYFSYDSAMWTMDADGGSKNPLPAALGFDSEPSYGLHGNMRLRWFLKVEGGDLYARAHDGFQVLSVQLTFLSDQITVGDPQGGYIVMARRLRWAEDDGFASFPGTDVTTGNEAIYVLDLDWDPNTGEPQRPALADPAPVVHGSDLQGLLLDSHDWAPDGTEVVYGLTDSQSVWQLWVKDVTSPGSNPRYLAEGGDPDWSPDGGRIAFNVGYDIASVDPLGGNYRLLVRGGRRSAIMLNPRWAPIDPAQSASTHLVYSRWAAPGLSADVYRVTAGGGRKTNLTSDLPGQYVSAFAIAWR